MEKKKLVNILLKVNLVIIIVLIFGLVFQAANKLTSSVTNNSPLSPSTFCIILISCLLVTIVIQNILIKKLKDSK